jgi:dipeptide/tripeptide permease
MTETPDTGRTFPRLFWIANSTELLERAAFYSVASFIVIYLKETLGFTEVFATFLNGTLLWGLIYFLPPLSGTLADKFGFRGGLLLAFVTLAAGYFLMGNVRLFAGPGGYEIPIVVAIVIIGIGGSFVKPCISGTVQKTNAGKAVLAFGIFYMVINIGSLVGRLFSYGVRVNYGIPAIFWIAVASCAAALVFVFVAYRDPTGEYLGNGAQDPAKPKRSLGKVLADMVLVLGNLRFTFFLIVMAGFWAMYVQIYNLIPLFLRAYVDADAPVELYTLVNPVMIVAFQLLVTKVSKHFSAIRSIVYGLVVAAVGMCVNIIPVHLFANPAAPLIGPLPINGFFMLIAIASVAMGEMLAAPRMYEYIGAISPKGKEGLFLGYANLPMALGTLGGGPLGGYLFVKVARDMQNPTLLWLLVAALSGFSVVGLLLYNYFIKRADAKRVA